jgi:hypothetical protein
VVPILARVVLFIIEAGGQRMNGLFRALTTQHHYHDVLLDRFVRDVRAGDVALAEIAWEELQRVLTRHMDAEEIYLLPTFDHHDPEEAHALWSEHQALRTLLAEIGVGLAVGLLQADQVEELEHLFWNHTEREHKRLYLWADCMLDTRQGLAILERIGAYVPARSDVVSVAAAE